MFDKHKSMTLMGNWKVNAGHKRYVSKSNFDFWSILWTCRESTTDCLSYYFFGNTSRAENTNLSFSSVSLRSSKRSHISETNQWNEN